MITFLTATTFFSLYKKGKRHICLHLDLSHLCEWLWSPLNSEFCVTELTIAGVGGWKPLFQTALVHFPKRTGAVARGKQRLPSSSFMTNPTHPHIAVRDNKNTKNVRGNIVIHDIIDMPHKKFCCSVVPLQAHCFDNRGEWAAILRCNLGNILGLCGRVRLFWILRSVRFRVPRIITKRARQLAAPWRRHGSSEVNRDEEDGEESPKDGLIPNFPSPPLHLKSERWRRGKKHELKMIKHCWHVNFKMCFLCISDAMLQWQTDYIRYF